jgi:hypothetical protein
MVVKSAVIEFPVKSVCLKYNEKYDLISKRDFGQF